MAPETVSSPPLPDLRKPDLPAPPRRVILFGVLALASGIGLVGFAHGRAPAEYAGHLQVQRMPVVAQTAGVVTTLLSHEGEAIHIGDPLLTISNADIAAQRTQQQQRVTTLSIELEQALARAELELDWRFKELNQDIFTTHLQSTELLEEKYRHEMEKVALGDLLSSDSVALWTQEDTVFDSLVLQDYHKDEGRLNTVLRLEAASNSADVCSAQVDLCDQQLRWLEELKESLPTRVQQSFGVPLAEAQLKQAQAELNRLEAVSDHEIVDSSAIGTVGVFRHHVGDFVNRGDVLVEILDHARQSLSVEVPSANVDGFQVGGTVTLIFPGNQRRIGRVAQIAPQTVPVERNTMMATPSLIGLEVEPAGMVWPAAPVGTEIKVLVAN